MLMILICSVKENAEALLCGSEEICVELNAEETKYVVMSHE